MENKNIQAEEIVNEYGDLIFRTCLILLSNREDAQDAVQDTIIKYIKKSPDFKDKIMRKHGF